MAPSTPTLSIAATISSPVTCSGQFGTLCQGRCGVLAAYAWTWASIIAIGELLWSRRWPWAPMGCAGRRCTPPVLNHAPAGRVRQGKLGARSHRMVDRPHAPIAGAASMTRLTRPPADRLRRGPVGRARLWPGVACGDPRGHLVGVVREVILGEILGRGAPHAVM